MRGSWWGQGGAGKSHPTTIERNGGLISAKGRPDADQIGRMHTGREVNLRGNTFIHREVSCSLVGEASPQGRWILEDFRLPTFSMRTVPSPLFLVFVATP